MYIHEIRDAKIGWGDTLANPVFLDADGNLLLFDAIVANMPFSKDKWASGLNPGGESSGKGKKEFRLEATREKFRLIVSTGVFLLQVRVTGHSCCT